MRWVAPSERDDANHALEKRVYESYHGDGSNIFSL